MLKDGGEADATWQNVLSSFSSGIVQQQKFTHTFSCECDDWKQQWIRDTTDPELLFANSKTVAMGHGEDLLSHNIVQVPDVDIFAAGFSCKDVSAMNIFQLEWLARYEVCEGTTAETLSHSLAYCCVRRPRFIFLENVPAFAVRGGESGISGIG